MKLHYLPEGYPTSVTSRKGSVESGWLITSFAVKTLEANLVHVFGGISGELA